MTLDEWKSAIEPAHERFYDVLVGSAGCGAFDGGCVVVAQALQAVVGGDIHVVVDEDGRAQHAAVFVDEHLWDYDGPRWPKRFIREFDRLEGLGGRCASHRPIASGDLPEAVRDDALMQELSSILREVVPAASASPSP